MKRILLTGCGGFAAIGFLRCLKKANEKFYLVGTDSNPYNVFLNLTDKTYLIPSADHPNYIGALIKVIKKEKIDLVWSQPQPEVQLISKNREQLAAKVFLPDKKTVEIYEDKAKTAQNLEAKKIPVPKSMLIIKKNDLKNALREFGGKVWLRAIKGTGGKGAFLAGNFKQAQFWMEFNKGWGNFSASEYLPGKGYGCDMLFFEGKLVFSQVKERLTYFMSKVNIVGITGTTGVLKTVHNQKLNELCEKVIYSICERPHGVFDVDIKCDEKGHPKVTEINVGRFLSSSVSLFYKTGFLAPYYAVKLALDGKLPVKIKKRNPIPKDIIISRQLDIEPQSFLLKDIEKISKEQNKNLISLVK